jgi:hypothetical protein
LLFKSSREIAIDLYDMERVDALEQRSGQRSFPGADFHNEIVS